MLWDDKFLFLRMIEAIDRLMFSLVGQSIEALFQNPDLVGTSVLLDTNASSYCVINKAHI